MIVSNRTRVWLNSLAAIVAATTLGVVLVGVLAVGNIRLTVAVLGGALFGIGAHLSGNARLTCFWALLLTLPLNLGKYLTEFSDRGGGEATIRIEISDVFLAAMIAFLARDIWTRHRPGLRIPKVTYAWIAIMAMGAGAALVGVWQKFAVYEMIRMFKVMMLFLLVCNELHRRRHFLHCVAAIAVSGLIQAIIGITQYIKGANLGLEILGETSTETIQILAQSSIVSERIWRVSGLLLHPNLLGIFLAVGLPLAIAMFLVKMNRSVRLFFLVCAIAGLAALIATFSRSSWVSFATAAVLLGFLALAHGAIRREALLPGAIAAICLAGILVGFSGKISSRLFESKEVATFGREEFKRDAKSMIEARPILGFGLNSYVDAVLPYSVYTRKTYGYWVPPVHHIYYLWWAELGIVGLTLHLGVIAGIVWAGIGNLRIRDPFMYAINAACLCGMAAFLVDGFFSFSLRVNAILRFFWLLAGLILAVRYWRLDCDAGEPPDARYGDPETVPDGHPNGGAV